MLDQPLSVTDFVAIFNQTLEYAYPGVIIVGELANFRVSKNKWVYFDLKDENSTVKFFGTIYMLPGPLEDGMMLQVRGTPRLHNLYGFSVTAQKIQPIGKGSIKKAATLLETKLRKEGLFEQSRKREIVYPPKSIGLIASGESAAYVDFVKILSERWGGVDVKLADVQVQGEAASAQIILAIEHFNQQAEPPDVLVLTRGGGSPEDLSTFSNEQVTRAVVASRIPTVVAIGHEIDISLAELAADKRASTPSNAAELLVPDKQSVLARLADTKKTLLNELSGLINNQRFDIDNSVKILDQSWNDVLGDAKQRLQLQKQLLKALNPEAALKRGYVLVEHAGTVIGSAKQLKNNDKISLRFRDGKVKAKINDIAVQ